MRFNNRLWACCLSLLAFGMVFNGCRLTKVTSLSTPKGQSLTNTGNSAPLPAGDNIMLVTVNGTLCDPSTQYPNEPCTSVTVCQPGTSNCQTINNILVDTGSYGLRIFSSVLTSPLTPVTIGTSTVGECAQFGDGNTAWGRVELAGVKLANEPVVEVPIQVIDTEYGTAPATCSSNQGNPLTNPQHAGFNGILGVGLLTHDCGALCTTKTSNGIYYRCNGAICSQTTITLANQVQNPVSRLPTDNNGVIFQLPSISPNGVASAEGVLILGIGTQSNNSPSSKVTAYTANGDGSFSTVFSAYNTTRISGYIDSSSNVMIIPSPASELLPDCNSTQGGNHSNQQGFFCPVDPKNLTATNFSALTSTSVSVAFQIANFNTLLNTGNFVFMNVGAKYSSGLTPTFSWGLPFFFGKSVFVGFEKTQSSLGTGPYWAY